MRSGLALAVFVGTSSLALRISAETPSGIYAKICGTGALIFISLGGNETPDPSQPHLTACHAICTHEDLEIEGGEIEGDI